MLCPILATIPNRGATRFFRSDKLKMLEGLSLNSHIRRRRRSGLIRVENLALIHNHKARIETTLQRRGSLERESSQSFRPQSRSFRPTRQHLRPSRENRETRMRNRLAPRDSR
jgi:hypothetical protein